MDNTNFDENKDGIWDEFPILETDRLFLRDIRLSDKQRLYEIWGNPLVNQYTDFPGLDDPEMVHTFIKMARERFNSKNGIRWGIILKENDLLIGTIGFNRWITQFGNFAVLGYDLDSAYWRNGYSYEAGRAVIEYGYNIMKLHRIEADIDTDNIASKKLLEKLEFELEGIHRDRFYWGGKYQTAAMYAKLSEN